MKRNRKLLRRKAAGGARTRAATGEVVATLLEDVAQADPALGRACAEYVLTGAGGEPISRLDQGARRRLPLDGRALRRGLGVLAEDPALLAPAQWIRLGELIAACGQPNDLPVPDWFGALVKARVGRDPVGAWDIDLFEALLAASGLAPAAVPEAIIGAFLQLAARWTRQWWPLDQPIARYLMGHLEVTARTLERRDHDFRLAGCARWLALYPDLAGALVATLAEYVAQPSPEVRLAAAAALATLPPERRREGLALGLMLADLEALTGAPAASRAATAPEADADLDARLALRAVSHFARTASADPGRDSATVLDELAGLGQPGREVLAVARAGRLVDPPAAPSPPLAAALDRALARNQALERLEPTSFDLPPLPPDGPAPADLEDRLRTAASQWQGELRARLDAQGYLWSADKDTLAALGSANSADLAALRDWLVAGSDQPPELIDHLPGELLARAARGWESARAIVRMSVQTDGDVRLRQAYELMARWLPGHDLRALAAACEAEGRAFRPWLVAAWALEGLDPRSERAPVWPAERVWPFFAERPDLLARALADDHAWDGEDRQLGAFALLGAMPAVPDEVVPALGAIATGTSPKLRAQAQAALARRPDCLGLARLALLSGPLDLRLSGARWIGATGSRQGLPILREALARERAEVVEAAILGALATLGEDLGEVLSPQALHDAARSGLAAKPPAALGWFPFEAVPACRWAAGGQAPPEVIKWWLTLATKMADPAGAGLIPLYLSRIEAGARAALGTFVLNAWLAEDVRRPTDAEARALADQEVSQWMSAPTPEAYEAVRARKAAGPAGSAFKSRGLLAFALGAPGSDFAAAAGRYARDHHRRRKQLEALLTVAAAHEDLAATQFLLTMARGFRAPTVRAAARELVDQVAERRGWTADQLADRTIPTAGLDAAGNLELDYGPRAFNARIARAAKTGAHMIALTDADGRELKTLPQPRAGDDAEAAKEAKALLAAARKELRLVVAAQRQRLWEAMCLGRTWPAGEWRELLLDHPVMRHLVARLVWWTAPPPGGDAILFQPTDQGQL
ncbi:MAG: DUF4132 domain-containing protein, partial [Bifidobacteriaceae bacterium]|nr:DUF4132 domain-containing protein [Bifidobacteriaceae bacterium]